MLIFIVSILLGVVTLSSISLLRVYSHVPAKELKRRARMGDDLAKQFHRAVAYGVSLEILLWFIAGISSALLFVVLTSNFHPILAFFVCAVLVWLSFAWLPNAAISKYTVIMTNAVTPAIHWILEILEPILKHLAVFGRRFNTAIKHTGIYEKEDLIELIQSQRKQSDNRISDNELDIAMNALQFGDKKVGEVMTPKRMIRSTAPVDMVGPVLMGELHKSGHSRFPVYKDKNGAVIGVLYLRDVIGAKEGGFVKDIMRKDVVYVNEDQGLIQVLDAFIKTKHQLFMVVNDFEEITGLLTVEDIFEQILGRQIVDEFDQYDNLRAVASIRAQKDNESHQKAIEPDSTNSHNEEPNK